MPRTKQSKSGDGIWAVALAFQIVELLAKSDKPWRITDLAIELGTTKPRVYRYLQTLKSLGYVTQESDTERYSAGIKLTFLSAAASAKMNLFAITRPIMFSLRDTLGLTIVVSRREGDRIYALTKLDAVSSVSFTVVVGAALEPHCTAQGKLLLAFSNQDVLERLLSAPLKKFTSQTIVDPDDLRVEIAKVRKQGWAHAANERLTGLNVVAVPVFNGQGSLEATIGAVGSTDELAGPPKPDLIATLRRAAAEISASYFDAGAVDGQSGAEHGQWTIQQEVIG